MELLRQLGAGQERVGQLVADVLARGVEGQRALELASRGRELVLCGLGIQGMDVYETYRQLRQLPGLQRTVIAVVSGYGRGE